MAESFLKVSASLGLSLFVFSSYRPFLGQLGWFDLSSLRVEKVTLEIFGPCGTLPPLLDFGVHWGFPVRNGCLYIEAGVCSSLGCLVGWLVGRSVGWLVGSWSSKVGDRARTSPPAIAWGSSRPSKCSQEANSLDEEIWGMQGYATGMLCHCECSVIWLQGS